MYNGCKWCQNAREFIWYLLCFLYSIFVHFSLFIHSLKWANLYLLFTRYFALYLSRSRFFLHWLQYGSIDWMANPFQIFTCVHIPKCNIIIKFSHGILCQSSIAKLDCYRTGKIICVNRNVVAMSTYKNLYEYAVYTSTDCMISIDI